MGLLVIAQNKGKGYEYIGNDGKVYSHSRDNFCNKNAVHNLIYYVLREGKNANRRDDLKSWRAFGLTVYGSVDDIVSQMLYIQTIYGIDSRGGRRMNHLVFSFTEEEIHAINGNYALLTSLSEDIGNHVFWKLGFQNVVAVHDESFKRVHIHIAINAISYITGEKFHMDNNDMILLNNDFNRFLAKQITNYSVAAPFTYTSFFMSNDYGMHSDQRDIVPPKTIYYGVYGYNGLGVYDKYDYLNRVIEHGCLIKPEYRWFDSKSEAFSWAKDSYNQCQSGGEVDDIYEGSSSEIKLNWILFKRDIRKQNEKIYGVL